MTGPGLREPADLVLAGGGVKGAGLAGAVAVLTQRYDVQRVAGTSAGALVAALVASGQTHRLEELLIETDFGRFLDPGAGGRLLGPFGNGLDVMFTEGIYRGRALHAWIASALADAGVHTFRDLYVDGATRRTPVEQRYRLVVVVSDVSRGRMLRLPWDCEELLGLDPDDFPVADAVRASASIPFFFRPWKVDVDPLLTGGRPVVVLTDGAMLSNFPISLFDDETDRPTIGVKLSARLDPANAPWHAADDPLSLTRALIATMTNAHDQLYVDQQSVCSRTVFVETTGVRATDFRLTREARSGLYDSGVRAAHSFLTEWDFEAWRRQYPPVLALGPC